MFTRRTRKIATGLVVALAGTLVVAGISYAQESSEPPVAAIADYRESVSTLGANEPEEQRDAHESATLVARFALHPEAQRALGERAADLKGFEPSLYRGKYFSKRSERFRECVIERESKGNYRAANASSSARGAYQFLDNAWRESLVHMLRPEAKKHGLLPQVRKLNNKPIHKWSRYWQDAAFYTVYNHDGPGSGAHHWGTFGQTHSCK